MSELKEMLRDLRPKNFNEFSKGDRAEVLYNYLEDLTDFYIAKKHKARQEVAYIFDALRNVNLAKALKRIMKSDDAVVPVPFATVLADFLERSRDEKLEDKVLNIYAKAIDVLIAKRIKEVSKKTGLSKDILQEVLTVVATPDAISSPNYIGVYVQRIMRRLYSYLKWEKDSESNELVKREQEFTKPKILKKMFKEVLGKDLLNDVAVNVLLERKDAVKNFNDDQKALWGLATNFALDTIEKNEKKDIKEMLKYYVMRRSKDASKERDSARRLQFAQISEEDYPKIHKAYKKLNQNESFKKFL